MSADLVLQIFARAPKLGRVKTRLGRVIGAAAALHWYRILVHRTLMTASTAPAQVQVWCPYEDDPFELEQIVDGLGMTFYQQCSGDLGRRMEFALQVGLEFGPRVFLIGADCPVWTPAAMAAGVQTGQSAPIRKTRGPNSRPTCKANSIRLPRSPEHC